MFIGSLSAVHSVQTFVPSLISPVTIQDIISCVPSGLKKIPVRRFMCSPFFPPLAGRARRVLVYAALYRMCFPCSILRIMSGVTSAALLYSFRGSLSRSAAITLKLWMYPKDVILLTADASTRTVCPLSSVILTVFSSVMLSRIRFIWCSGRLLSALILRRISAVLFRWIYCL